MNDVSITLSIYSKKLLSEKGRLTKKYGEASIKVDLLNKKIDEINLAMGDVKNLFLFGKSINYKDNEYQLAKTELGRLLKNAIQLSNNSMQFTSDELENLFKHKGDDVVSRGLKFFGIKTDTEINLKKIAKEINKRNKTPSNKSIK